ncbi:MAG TPA: DUF4349 domain-containing protein [Actinomycetota bacterium]|nr:DUF4349 domain-containing protein [Actinomycetota bacterium]
MIKKAALTLVAFLSVAAVVGFLVSRPFGGADEVGDAGGAARAPTEEAAGEGAPGGAAAGAVAETFGARGTAVSELPGLPSIGEAVVKEAEIAVEVRRGTFAQAFDDASLVAGRYGGHVESSSMAGARARSGSLVVRVPSDRFDAAMSDFRALGTVTGESISGRVVTQEFVDLEARLRTWESQEAVLLDLMEEATSVEATLRIQRELQDVQFRIEQIEGQLRVLEDRTALATIHLSMVEMGAPVVPQQPSDTRPSLAEAWEKAVDGFLGVAYATVVGLGYLLPISALGLAVWFAYRRIQRRLQPEAPTPAA